MLSNVRAKLRIPLGQKVIAICKAVSLSVLNQAVSSGTNFIFGLYLVRILTPLEFGLYGIGFAVSLFYANIGNALFLTQMVVYVPDKALNERLPYAARMLVAVGLFCFITSFSLVVLIKLSSFFSVWMQQYAKLGIAIIAASISFLLKDFFVRHAYTARKESWALWVNIWVVLALGCFVLAQHLTTEILTSADSLWFYALSNAVGALAGFLLVRLPLRAIQIDQLRADIAEAWSGGRWEVASTCFYFLRTQVHIIITASMLGPVAVAYLNATRLLVTPIVMLTPALGQVIMPRLATLRTAKPNKIIKFGERISVVFLLIAVAYSSFLLIFLRHISPLVFGSKYDSSLVLVLAWCFSATIHSLRYGIEMLLQVLRKFSFLAAVNIISSFVALVSVYSLIKIFGTVGAISGVVVGEVVLIGLLWWKSKSCL